MAGGRNEASGGKTKGGKLSVITMKQLLEAGVHFGHQTKRWNPKMKRYIFSERNGIYIIDLQQTIRLIETSYEFIKDLVAKDGTVLFVGTKKQAQEAIKEEAIRCEMPYVSERWLGGLLTNFKTVSKRIDYLDALEKKLNDESTLNLTKKELAALRNEHQKLLKNLGGLRTLKHVPDALFVVDPKKEQIAVNEAIKLDIPIVAIVDTNCDPDEVDYVIPGNDDAIRASALITRVIANAVLEGKGIAESLTAEKMVAAERETAEKAAEEEKAKLEAAAVSESAGEEVSVKKAVPAAEEPIEAAVEVETVAKDIEVKVEKEETKMAKTVKAKKPAEEKAPKKTAAAKKETETPAEKAESTTKKKTTASSRTKSSKKSEED